VLNLVFQIAGGSMNSHVSQPWCGGAASVDAATGAKPFTSSCKEGGRECTLGGSDLLWIHELSATGSKGVGGACLNGSLDRRLKVAIIDNDLEDTKNV
jgi:hypothetical protein